MRVDDVLHSGSHIVKVRRSALHSIDPAKYKKTTYRGQDWEVPVDETQQGLSDRPFLHSKPCDQLHSQSTPMTPLPLTAARSPHP